MPRCSTCHRAQPESSFATRKDGSLGKTCARCREKQAARQRELVARDPEGYRAASRQRARESKARRRQPEVLLDTWWVKFFHGDSRYVLDHIERPDLVITDPPYGRDVGRHPKHGSIAGDKDMWIGYAVLKLAIRKLKPGGQIYVFGDRRRPFDLEQAGGGLVKVLGALPWIKQGALGRGDSRWVWAPTWEYISWGERLADIDDPSDLGVLRQIHERRDDPMLREIYEDGLRSSDDPAVIVAMQEMIERVAAPAFDPDEARTHAASIVRSNRPERVRRRSELSTKRHDSSRHPTEKPVDLLEQLIAVGSRPYELVVDPFAGSGSTGVAAVQLGRRFVGIELEERYARVAAERIASAKCRPMNEVMGEELRLERHRGGGKSLGEWLADWLQETRIEEDPELK